MPPKVTMVDPELGPLTDDRLTRDFRVFQRQRGHRFSVDDVATAYVAWTQAPNAERILDLGCGLGSVLIHLAWTHRAASLVGIEAQDVSFALLRRNVARNDLAARVAVHHGDLRDPASIAKLGQGFPLITGTPPYFPLSAALEAEDAQRAYARIEYRGGVEAYLATGAPLLAAGGVLVLCGDARAEGRVREVLPGLGLALRARTTVVPRTGRDPLFAVWTLVHAADACPEPASATLTLRDGAGATTPDAHMLRTFSGFA
jgi:tRNA1(Val) A37 N6-methylase TrmN6